MELPTEILVGITVFILAYIVTNKYIRSRNNLPPSLPWLPIVGSLPFLSDIATLHVCLADKAKRYGNVYSFYAGHRQVVVLNGLDAIKEALVSRSVDFAGRPTIYAEKHIWNPETKGMAFKQYNDEFKTIRSTCLSTMKKLGLGQRATMEHRIHEEIRELFKYIRNQGGKSFNISDHMHMYSLNIIYSIMIGKRFEFNDPLGKYIAKELMANARSLHPIFDLFPIVRYLPQFSRVLDGLAPRVEKYYQMLRNSVDAAHDEDQFVGEFLKKAGSKFDRSELAFILRDFLGGGMETSSTFLLWAILLLCNYSSIQRRVQHEIDSVVAPERLPSLTDKLPYLEATVLEMLRLKTIAPLGIPHMTICDTEVAGFFIPANTQVVVNLWSTNTDPSVWTNPHEFRPERFLNAVGEVINRDRVTCFSFGKRSCPGEVLARQEAILSLGALMQQFDVFPPEGKISIPDKGKVDIVYSPDPFNVRIVPRIL